MSTAPDLKFQWPSNESEARQALNHAKWLSDVMSGDTMVMDELLEMANFTTEEMKEWSRVSGMICVSPYKVDGSGRWVDRNRTGGSEFILHHQKKEGFKMAIERRIYQVPQ